MPKIWSFICRAMVVSGSAASFFAPADALAQAAAPAISDGDTAWLLTSTALVLFMTVPGLALFYGGLVRARNVLSVLMQCFAVCCLASVLWLAGVYSLSFDNGGGADRWIGGMGKALLNGVGADSVTGSIPEALFFMFQMTFAVITPGLIVGAYVERIRFPAVLMFSGLWLVLVYAPVTHWVWGGGWLADLGVRDFAGGLVVHVTAGCSALVVVALLGNRRGFPHEVKPPHNPGMTMIGASMLWVGWFGFNAGSALAANGSAAMAMTVTQISAATASLAWMATEWIKFGKPSMVGLVTGTIAGLATITPASGFVGPAGALLIGLIAGVVCFGAVQVVKPVFKLDDTLDVFAVHGMGGIVGTLLTGALAVPALGGVGLPDGMSLAQSVWTQFVGIAATAAWAVAVSFIILKAVEAMVGLRVSDEEEFEGLDISTHGERSYEI